MQRSTIMENRGTGFQKLQINGRKPLGRAEGPEELNRSRTEPRRAGASSCSKEAGNRPHSPHPCIPQEQRAGTARAREHSLELLPSLSKVWPSPASCTVCLGHPHRMLRVSTEPQHSHPESGPGWTGTDTGRVEGGSRQPWGGSNYQVSFMPPR